MGEVVQMPKRNKVPVTHVIDTKRSDVRAFTVTQEQLDIRRALASVRHFYQKTY